MVLRTYLCSNSQLVVFLWYLFGHAWLLLRLVCIKVDKMRAVTEPSKPLKLVNIETSGIYNPIKPSVMEILMPFPANIHTVVIKGDSWNATIVRNMSPKLIPKTPIRQPISRSSQVHAYKNAQRTMFLDSTDGARDHAPERLNTCVFDSNMNAQPSLQFVSGA